MCRVRAIGSLRSFGWCWLVTSVLLCGLFAGALACAAAAVLFFFVDLDDPDDDMIGLLLALASVVGPLVLWGSARRSGAARLLKARIRFSRLLRRPSDPRTATVMASKRGGRTLILDIPWDGTGRGYQPLSEVRLALWMKAGMLVPGETGERLWRARR